MAVDLFQSDMSAGRQPQISEYLNWVPQRERSRLSRRLLQIQAQAKSTGLTFAELVKGRSLRTRIHLACAIVQRLLKLLQQTHAQGRTWNGLKQNSVILRRSKSALHVDVRKADATLHQGAREADVQSIFQLLNEWIGGGSRTPVRSINGQPDWR